MKNLSLLTTLLLTSSMVYAGWVAHNYNAQTSVYTSVPTSSCLEMWCERGCVEDSASGDAHCCPLGTNTTYSGGEHPQYHLCYCPENQEWDTATNGCKVLETCPVGTSQYTNYLGEKSCCNTTTHTLSDIAGTPNKSCCPNESPYWDADSQTCLAACGPNTEFGIVLILDRSGSMKQEFSKEVRDRKYRMMDKALAKLKIYPNAYSAVFQQDDYTNNPVLKWGKNSKDEIKKAIFDYTIRGETGFSEAFEKIEKFCDGNQNFVILWITDGKINEDKTALKKSLKNKNCNATLYLVSAKEKDKETYSADKWINFENFSSSSVSEFNDLADSVRCYNEGERTRTETIGEPPSCADQYGYWAGECHKCAKDKAVSCDYKTLICEPGYCGTACSWASKDLGDCSCVQLPENATCDDSYDRGWKCNANFYRNSNDCVPCPDEKKSPAGSTSKMSCK
jgi:hypothetical protein